MGRKGQIMENNAGTPAADAADTSVVDQNGQESFESGYGDENSFESSSNSEANSV